jgi:hypothetical protein
MYLKNIGDAGHILQLDFPVCRFALGGTNEIHRFKAIKEDYKIRTQIIGLSNVGALTLYLLHFVHTLIKRTVPGMAQLLRYKRPQDHKKPTG